MPVRPERFTYDCVRNEIEKRRADGQEINHAHALALQRVQCALQEAITAEIAALDDMPCGGVAEACSGCLELVTRLKLELP